MASIKSVCAFALLAMLAVAPFAEAAGRGLLEGGSSKIINPRPSNAARNSITRENAETSANPTFSGVHRMTGTRRSVANADNNGGEAGSKPTMIQPRARSAQTAGPNRGNGAGSMPALVMGGMSRAQTYEGATSISTSDSLALNAGGKSAIANSRVTTRTGTFRGASAREQRSWGVTSNNGVNSKALSGNANGKIVLAQGREAVAYAQTGAKKM